MGVWRRRGRVDLVLGSDVTYFDDDYDPLLQTLSMLGAPDKPCFFLNPAVRSLCAACSSLSVRALAECCDVSGHVHYRTMMGVWLMPLLSALCT